MADITKMNPGHEAEFTHSSPFGNGSAIRMNLSTSAGVLDGGDSQDAIAIGDVVVLGTLQKGFRIDTVTTIIVAAGLGAIDVGFRYADGVDDTDVPEDDDYFEAALDSTATGRNVSDANIVKLPKEALLIVTFAAAQTGALELDVLLNGVMQGE